MKRISISTILTVFCLLILASCGGKKGDVKNFAERFVRHVNNNQTDSIMEMYPVATFDSFNRLSTDSIQVNEDNGNYKVNFGQNQWIEVTMYQNGNMTITNSKGIAEFPEDRYKAAVATGMIDDTILDLRAQELLNDNKYFRWLNEKNKQKMQPIKLEQGKISKKYGVDLKGRPCEGAVERMTCTVTNTTDKPISGKDYKITYSYSYWTCSDGSSPDGHARGEKPGIDLAPGESGTINLAVMDYGLKNVAVDYNVPIDQLLTSNDLYSGTEYKEYKKLYGDTSKKNSTNKILTPEEYIELWKFEFPIGGDLNQFAWLSDYKLKSSEIEGFSKEQYRKLRNAIFALHGYIFKSDDLRDYFGNFSGYVPETSNVTDFNKTEQANISLIKTFE